MSYATIARNVQDNAYNARIQAAIAQEQKARGEPVDPFVHAVALGWSVASASDVEAAYASALEADNPNPGGDESVITDAMILGNVQAGWPAAS